MDQTITDYNNLSTFPRKLQISLIEMVAKVPLSRIIRCKDGNSFYRAVGFRYLEIMLTDFKLFENLLKALEDAKTDKRNRTTLIELKFKEYNELEGLIPYEDRRKCLFNYLCQLLRYIYVA
jgi:hypothetical protein